MYKTLNENYYDIQQQTTTTELHSPVFGTTTYSRGQHVYERLNIRSNF